MTDIMAKVSIPAQIMANSEITAMALNDAFFVSACQEGNFQPCIQITKALNCKQATIAISPTTMPTALKDRSGCFSLQTLWYQFLLQAIELAQDRIPLQRTYFTLQQGRSRELVKVC
jgi:hypothetical protein